MLDDFFVRALLAGIGVAIVAGPLGCFIIWRRLAYFGDTLAHAALLGVAVALLLQLNMAIAVFGVCALIALALVVLQRNTNISSDALLGLLSHSALAVGLVALAFMSWTRVDIPALLFGDILSVSVADIGMVYAGAVIVLAVLWRIWTHLFAASVSRDIAMAENGNPDRVDLVFMLLVAAVVAISLKIVGVLLITALLVIPAATARRFASSPEAMAVLAVAFGIAAVVGGLFGSLNWDSPSGPSIVVAAFVMFLLTLVPLGRNSTGE